jgi:hypothetical protein
MDVKLAADYIGQHLLIIFQHSGSCVVTGTFNGKDKHFNFSSRVACDDLRCNQQN